MAHRSSVIRFLKVHAEHDHGGSLGYPAAGAACAARTGSGLLALCLLEIGLLKIGLKDPPLGTS